MFVEIFLEPADFLIPVDASSSFVRRGIFDVAIKYREMCVSPVKRIVRRAFVENILDVVTGTLVISDCRKKCRSIIFGASLAKIADFAGKLVVSAREAGS